MKMHELREIVPWKTIRNWSLCTASIREQRLSRIRVDNATFTPIAPYFQEPLIAGIKRRLRMVILLSFSRFRRRLANEYETYSGTIACFPYLGIGDQKRAGTISIHRRASNFPDDKSLWNSSKAWPTTWTSAWRYGRNFSSFHQDVREPLGEAISRLAFSRDDVYCAAYCFHSSQVARDYSILLDQFSL